MNILFLNSSRSWGGNELWTASASEALSEENEARIAYRCESVGRRFHVTKHRLPFLCDVDPTTIIGLVRLIRRHRIQILLPTKKKDYVLAGLTSRICGIKNCLRVGIVRDLRNRRTGDLVYNRLCDGIVVNAQAVKDSLLMSHYMRPDKIRVVYNGIDVERVRGKSCVEGQRAEKPFPFTVISSGRLTRTKRFDDVLRAFAGFLGMTGATDAGLVVLGDGEERDRLTSLSHQLHLAGKVTFTGFVDKPYPYLGRADLFVLASENEGISNALLEAFCLGLAVIATSCGGVREVIQHGRNGYIVGTGDHAAMAEKMCELYRNPETRRSIAEAALQRLSSQFSTTKMRDNLSAFLKEILAA